MLPWQMKRMLRMVLSLSVQSYCKKVENPAAFDSPLTPVATAIDIKSDYDAKHGSPTTSEKSGEVLVSGKLA